MLYLGHLVLNKASNNKPCDYCKRIINKDDSQRRLDREQRLNRPFKRKLKDGTTKEITSLHKFKYFHPNCFKKFYAIEEAKWEANPFRERKAPEHLEGRLVKVEFTPEQRRRRHTIQLYLSNKFRKQLIRAYNLQSTERVVEVQNRMADYLEELQSFGPGMELKWLNLSGEGCTGTNLELHELVKIYDRAWLEQLWIWKADYKRKMKIFRRQEEVPHMPIWRNND